MESKKLRFKDVSYIFMLALLIAGLVDMKFAIVAVVCMVAPVIVAALGKGRVWCGSFCPRGSFYDKILSKFSNNKPVPKWMRSTLFRLSVIIVMFTMFGIGIYKSWGDLAGIGFVIYRMIVVTTLIGIILSFKYNSRTWCNFCPMGSMASFINKAKGMNRSSKGMLNVKSNCVNCKLCEKSCPMSIPAYEFKGGALSHSDCIRCDKCVYVCPKDSITIS